MVGASFGGCEEKFTAVCGDPDVFFAYTATKQVMIKDRRLGLLNYCFMTLIAFYIFVIQLLLRQGYLHMWDADNTVRLSLKEPVVNGCNPLQDACLSNFTIMSNPGLNPWTHNKGKQYCCDSNCTFNASANTPTQCKCPDRDLASFNCTYMDGLGASEVNGREIAVVTRRVIWFQDRNASCFLDGGTSGALTCAGVWDTKKQGSTYFVKDIEDFVLEIDHTLSWETDDFSKLIPATRITEAYIEIGTGSEKSDEARNSRVCNFLGQQKKAVVAGTFSYVPATKAPCLVRITDIQKMLLNSTSLLDEVPVWVAMLASGLELEDPVEFQGENHSHRFAGAVVSITIDYSNLHPKPWWGLTTTTPYYIYRFKALACFASIVSRQRQPTEPELHGNCRVLARYRRGSALAEVRVEQLAAEDHESHFLAFLPGQNEPQLLLAPGETMEVHRNTQLHLFVWRAGAHYGHLQTVNLRQQELTRCLVCLSVVKTGLYLASVVCIVLLVLVVVILFGLAGFTGSFLPVNGTPSSTCLYPVSDDPDCTIPCFNWYNQSQGSPGYLSKATSLKAEWLIDIGRCT